MEFIEALHRAKYEGISIVPQRYSYSAQRDVQYYYNQAGEFVSQNDTSSPKYPTLRGDKYFNEAWVEYTGPYQKFELAKQKDLEDFYDLNNTIGHLYSQFKKFETLKRKLGM